MWHWRRLLRVPWTARGSNQSVLKDKNPENSLEGLMLKSWLIVKDPDAEKDWEQKKGETENEMVVWHHWLNGHEFEQAPGDGEEQRSLVFCSPWSGKELDTTKQLNNDKVTCREFVFYNQLLLNPLRLRFRKRRCLKIQERYWEARSIH